MKLARIKFYLIIQMFIKIFFCLIDHNLFITILEKSSGRNKEEFHSLPENV